MAVRAATGPALNGTGQQTMDWLSIAEAALRATESRTPIVDVARCLATRHPASGCDACVGVCPRGAIARGSRPRIDLSACDGCAACAAVCPSGAIESLALVEAHGRWLEAIAAARGAARSDATARCERASPTSHPDLDLVLPCLGALRPADLVTATIAGAEHVTVVRGDCNACERERAAGGIEETVRVSRAALAALDVDPSIIELSATAAAPRPQVPASTMSRRELFDLPRRWTRRATVELARETESRPAALARHSPDPVWRSRLDAALDSIAAASGGKLLPMGLGVATVTVGDGCDGCGLCVLGCPLGAIGMDGRSVIAMRRPCTGCGLCLEICPARAISLVPTTAARAGAPAGADAPSGEPAMPHERSLLAAERLADRAAHADRLIRSEAATRLLRDAGGHP